MNTQERTQPEIVTSIRLSAEEHAFIKALAEQQHRSVSGQIRFMVAQWRTEQAAA